MDPAPVRDRLPVTQRHARLNQAAMAVISRPMLPA